MKKLSLNVSAFQKGEVLTRSQLKSVLGGTGSGDNSDPTCHDSCGGTKPRCPESQDCVSGECEVSPGSNIMVMFCRHNP